MKYWNLLPALLFSTLVFAHPGGLDDNGEHNNRKTGEYHCHHAGCLEKGATTASAAEQSKAAIREAQQQHRPFSEVYNRQDWPHWIDADHDCQDTRTEILIASSQAPIKYRNEKRCSVIAGNWYDPYSGETWTNANDLDIDHLVPLKWAHTHGGDQWPITRKRDYANDNTNLIAVEDNANQAKSDKGPADWMPPNQGFRCEYLNRFNQVVVKYQLSYTASEKRIVERMQKACL